MPRPTGGGQPFLTPADTALDAAIEAAQAAHTEAIGAIARAEAERVLGADVMEHARWRGIPNEFFVGRRQFAVAVTQAWTAASDGTPVPFTHPQLYFRATRVDGRRGAGVADWTPVRSLCELGEIEARGRRG
jgi:hypothetical protein